MIKLRSAFFTAACSVIALAIAAGPASALSITYTGDQAATGGTVGAFGSTATTTFTGFSESAANAAVAAACSGLGAGWSCSTASVYEVELGLTLNATGSYTVSGSGTIACDSSLGSCPTGIGATSSNGVAAATDVSVTAYDPLSNEVLAYSSAIVDLPTNTLVGTGSTKHNLFTLTVNPTTVTGSGTAVSPEGDLYDNTDASWASEITAYSAANVTLNLGVSGTYSNGTATSTIAQSASVAVTSGQAYVDYLYSYTENYTSLPEPTTMFLMGSALLGAGLLRKRVKKQ